MYRKRMEIITPADIVSLVSSAMAAIASTKACVAYCEAISKVCRDDGDSGEDRVACGADIVTAVLAMMKAHPTSKDVHVAACDALSELARESADNAARIVASGGLGMVFAAMEASPDSWLVQQRACGALLSLADNAEGATLPEMRADGKVVTLLRRAIHAYSGGLKGSQNGAVRVLLWLDDPEVRICVWRYTFLFKCRDLYCTVYSTVSV